MDQGCPEPINANMKIAAAVCTYNGEKYIQQQLDSILAQSVPVDEIIVCDDGSTDNTVAIVNALAAAHPGRIQFHSNEQNLRVNKNFEKALSLSTGDFIFLSDQDDVWELNKVEKILDVFKDNPAALGVFSDAHLIDGDGNRRGTNSLWDNVLFIEKAIQSPAELYGYISNIRNMVTGATLCIRKETKELIFPFPDVKAMYHDEWIALILASRNALFYTTEKLISYRVHAAQQIGIIKPAVLKENNLVIASIIDKKYPKKFHYLYLIYKSYFRNYNKFARLKKSHAAETGFDLDTIIATNRQNILAIDPILKKSNFMLYHIRKLADKITGKRQFN